MTQTAAYSPSENVTVRLSEASAKRSPTWMIVLVCHPLRRALDGVVARVVVVSRGRRSCAPRRSRGYEDPDFPGRRRSWPQEWFPQALSPVPSKLQPRTTISGSAAPPHALSDRGPVANTGDRDTRFPHGPEVSPPVDGWRRFIRDGANRPLRPKLRSEEDGLRKEGYEQSWRLREQELSRGRRIASHRGGCGGVHAASSSW